MAIAGMAFPIAIVIAWMSCMPLGLACALVGFVVGVGCEPSLLPFSFAGELTVLLTAIALVLYTRIGSK